MDDIKVALIKAMESYFDGDTKRIDHAHKVTEYAERLLESNGGDYSIVIGSAVLHDIGIHEAERKHGSTSGKYQEIEGPPSHRRYWANWDLYTSRSKRFAISSPITTASDPCATTAIFKYFMTLTGW